MNLSCCVASSNVLAILRSFGSERTVHVFFFISVKINLLVSCVWRISLTLRLPFFAIRANALFLGGVFFDCFLLSFYC